MEYGKRLFTPNLLNIDLYEIFCLQNLTYRSRKFSSLVRKFGRQSIHFKKPKHGNYISKWQARVLTSHLMEKIYLFDMVFMSTSRSLFTSIC